MSRILRVAIAFTLIVAIVAGGLLSAGCSSKKAALVEPTIELFQFSKGATVDFDDATINSAATAEAGFKFGIMKSIYPTIFNANKETVANQLFPPPYWKGDKDYMTTTKYSFLSSGDQSTVDGTIFATKLSQAEQDIVTNAVSGFFKLYDAEVGSAKALEQNTAYGILAYKVSAAAAEAWKADAAAWMTALNSYAAANYSGKTYAQLTFIERKTVEGIVFAKGNGTINPEYAFWRAMTSNGFRNGIASFMNPTTKDNITASQFPGKTYAELNCIERPTVDALVWNALNADNQTAVNNTVAFMVTDNASCNASLTPLGVSAVAGFNAEVAGGTKMDLAFYKWLAYESFRNGTAATFYPKQVADNVTAMYPTKTYATLNACEQGAVNAAVWNGLGSGEQTYGTGAVTGMWGMVQAEMSDAFAMDQTTLAMTLRSATGTETSVINWKTDATTGGLTVQASFYRWMAKEALIALKGLGTLIRLSEAEFLLKVTNTNKYPIILQGMQYSFYINSTATSSTALKVDTAKVVAADEVWVPAESDLLVSVRAPVKQYNIITWLAVAGVPTATAMTLSADVWKQYQAGTETWIINITGKVSNDKGEDTQTLDMTL